MTHGVCVRAAADGTRPCWRVARPSAPRSCSTCTAARTCSSSGASGCSAGAAVTAITFTGPTHVGDASAPHGPVPRSAAAMRRMRSAGTAARSGGSTLAGSHSRSAHDRIGGQRRARPAPSRRRARSARSRVSPSIARWRTPVRNGRSSSSASSGPTWPVSASTELRPASTRSNGPSRVERGRERRRGRERVGAGERGVGDEHAVDVDVRARVPTRSLRATCRRRPAGRA